MNRKIYYQLFLLFLFSCSKAEKEVQEELFFSNTTESTIENSSNIQNIIDDSNDGGTIAEDSTSTTNEQIEVNGVVTEDGPLEKYLTLNKSITFQKVDGFGAGIKRRTEDLYKLPSSLREKVEKYCFEELEVNMIRFFIYHDWK